jgi:PHD/YefM family antitoxin component YafN of YafNO toxin-antitoxin module
MSARMPRTRYAVERRNGVNVVIPERELSALFETAHLLRSPTNAARLAAAIKRARGKVTASTPATSPSPPVPSR